MRPGIPVRICRILLHDHSIFALSAREQAFPPLEKPLL